MDELHPEHIFYNGQDINHEEYFEDSPSYADRAREFLSTHPARFSGTPLNLEWRDLRVSVPVKARGGGGSASASSSLNGKRIFTKRLLKGVSGSVQSGQVLAIMGASGSGKTTLLNLLAGRLDRSARPQISGAIHVNGSRRQGKKFRHQCAYVMQDEAMFGELTVGEQVSFSAELRLPSVMPRQLREERVERILEELGIAECRHTPLGGKFVHGVSGGERKRTAIAVEIVTDPSIIFLDEPTSGLDAANALRVIQTLRLLAQNGRAIVCTVHQPRSAIFQLVDNLLLLAEGEVMYNGPARQACTYFSTLGFRCPPNYSTADYLVDVTTINWRSFHNETVTKKRLKYLAERHRENMLSAAESFSSVKEEDRTWLEEQQSYGWEDVNEPKHVTNMYKKNFIHEFLLVVGRSVKLVGRAKIVNSMRLFQVLVFSLLLGMIWFGKGRDKTNELKARETLPGILFFIAINQSGAGYGVLFAFPLERLVITRERAAKMYRTSSYVLAKSVVDALKTLIFVAIFSVIVYFMVGFRATASAFGQFVLAMWAMTMAIEALAGAIAVIAGDPQASSSLLTVTVVLTLLFGGYFVKPDKIPDWLQWLRWASFMWYGYNCMVDVEFPPNSTEQLVKRVRIAAELKSQLTYWQNVAVLCGMTVALKFITYLGLRYLRGPRYVRM